MKRIGKFQAIENDYKNQAFKGLGQCFGFDTIEEFRAGIKQLAAEGWAFVGLHPWHMGADLDLVYIRRA